LSSTPAVANGVTLSTSTLCAYGALAFPIAAAFIALQVMIPTLYATASNLSLSTIGILLLIARLADTFTDPIVGMLSDHTSNRWGKRRSWIALATPLLCVATMNLFDPSPDIGWAYLLFWTTAIYAAGTMYVVPMNAWGAELSSNYHQRSRISSIKAAFGLGGTVVALALPALFVPSGELSDALALVTQLVVVSVIICASLAWHVVPDNASTTLPKHGLKALSQLLVRASPFRQLVFSFLLNSIANAIPATLFLFYLEHVLAAPNTAGPLLLLYFVCSASSIPLWLIIAKRIGKHQTWRIAMSMACIFFLWTPFLSSDDIVWYVVIVATTGFFIGADLVLPNAIMGDLIEWDELETGLRRPGLFFAVWGTIGKIAFALAVGTTFPILEFIGFDARTENSEKSILGLALLYALPCVMFKITAIFLMRDYPITSEHHRAIRDVLKLRNDR